jgi:hypothetical protein
MTKKKYPDLVVWSEDKGFYANSLTYGSNLSAPSIRIDDVSGWKQSNINQLNSQFKAEYDEILKRAELLKQEFEWNHFVYTRVTYTFLPIVGHTYHVYEKDEDSFFMSIIDPNSWKQKFIGSTRLESTNKWVKI